MNWILTNLGLKSTIYFNIIPPFAVIKTTKNKNNFKNKHYLRPHMSSHTDNVDNLRQ